MIRYFAYGTNMSQSLMRRRCPTAVAAGVAQLEGWRFMVAAEGYATVVPAAGRRVHGLLWQLGPRDLAALDAYESVHSGLYRRRILTVRQGARRLQALVYQARSRAPGRPRPGYHEIVLAAAADAGLPTTYINELQRWNPRRRAAIRAVETGEAR